MVKSKKIVTLIILGIFISLIFPSYIPAKAAGKVVIPSINFVTAPVTEYTVGDRVKFDIAAPNYGGRVEYRVILWEDSKKTAHDLWDASNGFQNRYYTNWQPYGNNTFTLGWPINEPGTYRITVYVKRVGISNDKAVLKGQNCDSYKESVAFVVKPKAAPPEVIPGSGGENSGSTDTNTQVPADGNGTPAGDSIGNTTPGEGGGTTPGTGTATKSLVVESTGVVLSDGTRIVGSPEGGTNEFYVDLQTYDRLIGVRTYITLNKDCEVTIMGTKFTFKAHVPKTFGPKDFGMPDNDPPGISIGNLIDNYSDSLGYYSDSTSITDASNNEVIITIKMKVK